MSIAATPLRKRDRARYEAGGWTAPIRCQQPPVATVPMAYRIRVRSTLSRNLPAPSAMITSARIQAT